MFTRILLGVCKWLLGGFFLQRMLHDIECFEWLLGYSYAVVKAFWMVTRALLWGSNGC